jgi:hypothetical protein
MLDGKWEGEENASHQVELMLDFSLSICLSPGRIRVFWETGAATVSQAAVDVAIRKLSDQDDTRLPGLGWTYWSVESVTGYR